MARRGERLSREAWLDRHYFVYYYPLMDWGYDRERCKQIISAAGALVRSRGRPFRIPTLVPARRPDGACTFLTADGRCAVHAVSPFGCAFFDTHMADAEADRRSRHGLQAVLEA